MSNESGESTMTTNQQETNNTRLEEVFIEVELQKSSPDGLFEEEFDNAYILLNSKAELVRFSRTLKCGRLTKETRRTKKRFVVQAADVTREPELSDILAKIRECMSGEIVGYLEDVFLTCAHIVKARSRSELFLAVLTYAKLRSGGSLTGASYSIIKTFLEELFPNTFQVQSEDSWMEGITSFRDFLAKWEDLKDSKLVMKFTRLCNFLIGYGCFKFVGLDPAAQGPRLRDIGKNPLQHSNFLYCIIDTLSLTIQRCLIFAKTGEWDTFVHGAKTYGDWYDMCMRLKREATGMGNLEAHGTNFHRFVAEVKSAIEKGEAIVKFHTAKDGAEFRAARTMLNDLQMVNATIITKKSAQEERKAPFSVLVHGGSSVAKSSFVKMLYYYYGKLYNLPNGDEFRYTRNSSDKFWSGFATQAWCILLDDIAFRSASSGVEDISLAEMISVVNNVPFNPPQADLADKGKTPLRAELVIGTTNAKNLNAEAYFHCPLAILRRMPWVITIVPKPQFCREDAPTMICPAKMMAEKQRLIREGQDAGWPNFWLIVVDKVVPGGVLDTNGRQTARHEKIAEFVEITDFLDWFKSVTRIFKEQQFSAMSDDTIMSGLILCPDCNRTKCACVQVQSGHQVELPSHLQYGDSWTVADVHEDGHDLCSYSFSRGQYYVSITRVFRDQVQPETVHPVDVVDRKALKVNVHSVEYAEVLDVVLERQLAQEPAMANRLVGRAIQYFLAAYMKWGWFRTIADKAAGNAYLRRLVLWAVKTYAPVMAFNRRMFAIMGDFAERIYLSPHWKNVIKGLVGLGAMVLGYKLVNKAIGYFGADSNVYETQGARMSVTESHFMKNETESVWKNNRDHTTPLDVAPTCLNPNSTPDMMEKKILKNMARIRVKRGAGLVRPGNMFCIGGHLWVTDNHLFEGPAPYEIDIMFEAEGPGITSNRTITVYEASLFRQLEADRIWIFLPDINVRAVLHTLVAKETLQGTVRGRYIGFDPFVSPRCVDVHGLSRRVMQVDTMPLPYEYWFGKALQPTINGDCGKVLISTDPHCAILGLHQIGSEDCSVGAVMLTYEACEEAIAHFKTPLISPGCPNLSAEGVSKVLGPLHEKSPLRWLTQGSIIHYGSFQGYRRVPRSKVNFTLLGKRIVDERKWDVPFGKPDLKSWAPWHHALKDITSQTCKVDAGLVEHCVDSFVDDIMAELPLSSQRDLQKVRVVNAINGIPGVAHLDKMNLATSMGEPWCTTKKKYLVDMPTDTIPHAKIFTPDVMARISAIEDNYARGIRACPVFSGQKKDEARALEKLIDGKIRIFTGGPVDHSVVVRSYLHTFTKVMTENKILFETGVGCAAQSLEWEQFHDYLVQHGLDRMVAGDYEKFDKKMGAIWMLAAFNIIIRILRRCGWTDEELIPIFCIAEDTSHPYTNMGGDLIQTYGMNPSGHTLTVIINSLVNSLYLRYAYAKRSPTLKCTTFKKFVALLTYGDDNVMGVSPQCDWFNHTTIVEEMAAIGVGYTMADKKTKSIPFIHMSEISFLKRAWRWDEDVGALLCPLEMASIHKMQVVCVEGKTLSQAQHQLEVFHAALGEYFFHGKKEFEDERAWMTNMCLGEMDIELELKPFPTYDQLKCRFWKNSDGFCTKRLGRFEYNH